MSGKIALFKGLLILETNNIKMFVLDEADEMLSRGFKEQIYDVFKCMPSDVQVFLLLFVPYIYCIIIFKHF